jgi:hypothetical protein
MTPGELFESELCSNATRISIHSPSEGDLSAGQTGKKNGLSLLLVHTVLSAVLLAR